MNNPNGSSDLYSQPTTAGRYPQFNQQVPPGFSHTSSQTQPGHYPQNLQQGQPSQFNQWPQQTPPPPYPQPGQFGSPSPQPGQFGPPPYPPMQPPPYPSMQPPAQQPPLKPCSDVVLSILFLLDLVCWICAFFNGGVGNFGKSGVTGIVFTMLIIDWKGVLTFNGKIFWKRFGGGKRILLFCLYFTVLPLALIGYFVQCINASTGAKKQNLPQLPARKGKPALGIVTGFIVFIFVLAGSSGNASGEGATTTAPAPTHTQEVVQVAPTTATNLESTATPTPKPTPKPTAAAEPKATATPRSTPTVAPVLAAPAQQPVAPAPAQPSAQPVAPAPAQLFVSFTGASAVDNSSGSVSVHTLAGAALTISVKYCSGSYATSKSLQGTVYADSAGNYTWTWTPNTKCKGTATAYVTASLNGQSASNSTDFNVS